MKVLIFVSIISVAFSFPADDEIGVQKLKPLHGGKVVRSIPDRYWMSTFSADAQYADYYCSQAGKKLVSIETETKQRELERFLEQNDNTRMYWTSGSGTDISGEGNWTWGNGERISYSNLAPDAMNNPDASCLAICGPQSNKLKFLWLKNPCTEELRFICER